MDIEDFTEETGLSLRGEYHTVGGFVFHKLGRLPRRGDKVVGMIPVYCPHHGRQTGCSTTSQGGIKRPQTRVVRMTPVLILLLLGITVRPRKDFLVAPKSQWSVPIVCL